MSAYVPYSPLSTTTPRPRTPFTSWIAPLILLFGAATFLPIAAFIAPLYWGAQTTPGTIVASPNYHPVVTYVVDGVTYTVRTNDNESSRRIGDTVTIAFNPRDPQQASSLTDRVLQLCFGATSILLVITAIGLLAFWRWKRQVVRAIVESGQLVEATITGVRQYPAHQGNRLLTKVTCEWMDASRATHTFTTTGRFERRGYGIEDLPVATLPVYVDLDRPGKRYYVDDSVLDPRSPA